MIPFSPQNLPSWLAPHVTRLCLVSGCALLPTAAAAGVSYSALLPPLAFTADHGQGGLALRAKPLLAQSRETAAALAEPKAHSEKGDSSPSRQARKIEKGEGSQFGKVKRVRFIADYILLRATTTYQHFAYRQDGVQPLFAKHKSSGIDFDYEEFRVTADLGNFRFGGTFYGAEESGAKVFGEWPIAEGTYLGTGLAVVTRKTHSERYRKDTEQRESRDDNWNNYALSGYMLHLRPFYELQAELGLNRKKYEQKEQATLRPAGGDRFFQEYRGGFMELKASAILPLSPAIDLLWSYTYYRERMYKGRQVEGTVSSAVDGNIENHYVDLLHIRYTH